MRGLGYYYSGYSNTSYGSGLYYPPANYSGIYNGPTYPTGTGYPGSSPSDNTQITTTPVYDNPDVYGKLDSDTVDVTPQVTGNTTSSTGQPFGGGLPSNSGGGGSPSGGGGSQSGGGGSGQQQQSQQNLTPLVNALNQAIKNAQGQALGVNAAGQVVPLTSTSTASISTPVMLGIAALGAIILTSKR